MLDPNKLQELKAISESIQDVVKLVESGDSDNLQWNLRVLLSLGVELKESSSYFLNNLK